MAKQSRLTRMTGKRATIYLPGNMLEMVVKLGIPVSTICQAALGQEIQARLDQLQSAIEAGHLAEQALADLVADPVFAHLNGQDANGA